MLPKEVCQGTCHLHLHLETKAAKAVHQARTPADRELLQPFEPAYLDTRRCASKDSKPTDYFYCRPLQALNTQIETIRACPKRPTAPFTAPLHPLVYPTGSAPEISRPAVRWFKMHLVFAI